MVMPPVPDSSELLPPVQSVLGGLPVPSHAVVVGPPGSGKTVLAVHLARVASRTVPVDFIVASEHLVRWLRNEFPVDSGVVIQTWRTWLSETYRRSTTKAVPTIRTNHLRVPDWPAVLSALHLATPTERQVVVDEAQDVPSHLMQILSRTATSVLALADPYQRFADDGSSIEDLVDALGGDQPWPVFVLEQDFRVTVEVHRFATTAWAPDRPQVAKQPTRHGSMPRIVRGNTTSVVDEALRLLGLVGSGVVIAAAQTDRAGIMTGLEQAGIPVARANNASGSLRVLAFEALRGLEFEAVIIVLPSEFHVSWPVMAAHLYVAATRARQHLSVVIRGQLHPAVDVSLKNADGHFVEDIE